MNYKLLFIMLCLPAMLMPAEKKVKAEARKSQSSFSLARGMKAAFVGLALLSSGQGAFAYRASSESPSKFQPCRAILFFDCNECPVISQYSIQALKKGEGDKALQQAIAEVCPNMRDYNSVQMSCLAGMNLWSVEDVQTAVKDKCPKTKKVKEDL